MTTDEVLLSYRNLREKFADQAHESWSGWMRHLFKNSITQRSSGATNAEGVVIPHELAERWKRQMNTSYADLTEKEKASDRKEADAYLDILMKGM